MNEPLDHLRSVESNLAASDDFRSELRDRLRRDFEAEATKRSGDDAADPRASAEADLLDLHEATGRAHRRVAQPWNRARSAVLVAAAVVTVMAGLAALNGDGDLEEVVTVDLSPTALGDPELVADMSSYCATTGAAVVERLVAAADPFSSADASIDGALRIEAATNELAQILGNHSDVEGAEEANDRAMVAAAAFREDLALGRSSTTSLATLVAAHRETLELLPITDDCSVAESVESD